MGDESGAVGPHPVRETLGAYVDDQLSGDARQTVEDHLVDCDRCREVVSDLFAVIAMLGGLSDVAPPRSFRIGGSTGAKRPSDARFRADPRIGATEIQDTWSR